jgi:hypothetical protein
MNSFANTFNKIQRGIDKAQISALNKASNVVKARLIKSLMSELGGVRQKVVAGRIRAIKAKSSRPSATISVATKYGLNLGEFSPRQNTVKTDAGKRRGVSVDPGTGRYTVPGAWLWRSKSGKKLVLGRKGAYSNGEYLGRGARYKTTTLKTKPEYLRRQVEQLRPAMFRLAVVEMTRQLNGELESI